MKTRYAILQMIQAHYSNNFKQFDNFAKALAEVYAQDGDLQAKDEILKMMSNSGELTCVPAGYIPKGMSKPHISEDAEAVEAGSSRENDVENNNASSTTKDVVEKKADSDRGFADDNEANENLDEKPKRKHHKKTEQEEKSDTGLSDVPGQMGLEDFLT